MRPYGNMRGWKAVRTLNRDARIVANQPPYSFKPRPTPVERSKPRPNERWDKTSARLRNAAERLLKQDYPQYYTKVEKDILNGIVKKMTYQTDKADIEWSSAECAFFFRQIKIESWLRKWPTLLVSLSEEYYLTAQRFHEGAVRRRSAIKRYKNAAEMFESRIEAVICGAVLPIYVKNAYDEISDFICDDLVKEKVLIKHKSENVVYIDCWDTLVSYFNAIRDSMLRRYKEFIDFHAEEIKKAGIDIHLSEKDGRLVINGKGSQYKKVKM